MALSKHSVSASLEKRVGERWSVSASVGAAVAGSLTVLTPPVSGPGASHDLLPGPMGAVAASVRVLDEGATRPFVLTSFSLGVGTSATRPRDVPGAGTAQLTAFDGRVGVTAGKTLGRALTPYAAGRVFGLPVLWSYGGHAITGTDAFHYQLAAGLAVRLGGADLLVEGAPLGEQAITAGAGWSW